MEIGHGFFRPIPRRVIPLPPGPLVALPIAPVQLPYPVINPSVSRYFTYWERLIGQLLISFFMKSLTNSVHHTITDKHSLSRSHHKSSSFDGMLVFPSSPPSSFTTKDPLHYSRSSSSSTLSSPSTRYQNGFMGSRSFY